MIKQQQEKQESNNTPIITRSISSSGKSTKTRNRIKFNKTKHNTPKATLKRIAQEP